MSCKKKKRSFKCILKSRGPSTDPCGTPLITSAQVPKVVFIFFTLGIFIFQVLQVAINQI